MRTFWRTVSPERKKLEEAFLCIQAVLLGAAEGLDERFCYVIMSLP
jgi:hypothetical protein